MVGQSSAWQRGCEPLQAPSAPQKRELSPLRKKPALQAKIPASRKTATPEFK
jgi:hypothetical protein